MAIDYPEQRSEFEIQAWLFSQLRKRGIDARGEVKVPATWGSRGCRYDIVLFDVNRKARRVIEVKPECAIRKSVDVETGLPTREVPKYWNSGVPVDKVFGGEHKAYLEWVLIRWRTRMLWQGVPEITNKANGLD